MASLVEEMADWVRERPSAPVREADLTAALRKAFWLADSRQIKAAIELATAAPIGGSVE